MNNIKTKYKNYGGLFDPEKKQIRIDELKNQMEESDFWSDKKKSESIISEYNALKNILEKVEEIRGKVENNIEMIEILKQDFDLEMKQLLESEVEDIKSILEQLQIEILLSGPYDSLGVIMEIHSGAGGTEACDWANMLYRMYDRYVQDKKFKIEVTDIREGEEVGIKSITLLIHGRNAFGYLKNEKGVHRLVRLSPFDSNNRRHTSFASIDVIPLFEQNNIDIDIKESDLKIDVYRSSGKGGQGVNTTDSAVRITHMPTKIVVTCQNERSQIQNKATAIEILKNKLYSLELQKREEDVKKLKGDLMDINFGSQIRSYVMHPYSLVKDHRTNVETSNVQKVLDGNIELFINACLKGGNHDI